MQTETRSVSGLDMGPAGFLSFAMTALRLSKPAVIEPTDRIMTLEEVSWHDSKKDCWVIIYDRIYDLTHFFDEVCFNLFLNYFLMFINIDLIYLCKIFTYKLIL